MEQGSGRYTPGGIYKAVQHTTKHLGSQNIEKNQDTITQRNRKHQINRMNESKSKIWGLKMATLVV